MNNFFPSRMNTRFALAVTALCAITLTGCNNSNPQPSADNLPHSVNPPQYAYGTATTAQMNATFEQQRAYGMSQLATLAQQHPNQIGYLGLSLWNYYPITVEEALVEKYPTLQITQTNVMVAGSVWYSGINTAVPLHQELDRLIQADKVQEQQFLAQAQLTGDKQGALGAQIELNAIAAGDIRTFGFAVHGTFKDLETMVQQEYGQSQGAGKIIREVASYTTLLSNGMLNFLPTDPIAYSSHSPLDGGK